MRVWYVFVVLILNLFLRWISNSISGIYVIVI